MTSFLSSNTLRVSDAARVSNTTDISNTTDVSDSFRLNSKAKILLRWGLGFALIARLICSAVIPLTDTTEARYGEIARKMLETGDWITPQHDYGVPFWAKPPLSTWLSAFSMKIFGVNEFAVRLPSLLLGIGILMLVWHWAKTQRNRDFALTVCAVLASMSLFFMASGAVMTDESLTFCTTLAMISFWRAIQTEVPNNAIRQNKNSTWWGYLFFVALGFGVLAKGLLAGVLTFMPIGLWMLIHNDGSGVRGNCLKVWRALPWISGSIVMLAISLPWYIMAEHKTPGFLAYFILGEHFGRFLHSGWNGDKYGNAHAEALGMIWVFLFISTLPWSFICIAKFKSFWKNRSSFTSTDDGWLSYIVLWSFISIVFFSFAHNIIWTYPLPVLPALAILIVEGLQRSARTNTFSPRLAASSFVAPAIMLVIATMYASGYHNVLKASQKDSVAYFLQHRTNANNGLYYLRHRYYSSEFYSSGKAKAIEEQDLSALLNNGQTDYLMVQSRDMGVLTPSLRSHFEPTQQFGMFTMLREISAPPLITQK